MALNLELTSGVSSIEVTARRPDGGTDIILFARDFRLDWPAPFIFKEPILLRRGTVLTVNANGGAAKLIMNRY
jgi:hypothetical protein